MASLADVFKDKERANWLKAWLAIDIAKSGLENLADNEAQDFHRLIYSRVGSTCNSCSTKKLRRHKPCPRNSCDKVCQEIIKEHRYNSWSWKNTSGHLWHTNYWEIAKCYFPPDGYDAKSSIHETDFNGVVSFMLNCTRFDSKLSFPITTGKPTTHMPACLLYKAREIGKTVRHSSVMKVTDVELQDYFTTLSNLLSDSRYLSGDSDAQNAVIKLEELKKDTLHLTTAEMMCFLEAVDATLKRHLRDVAKDVVDTSLNDLRINTALCIDEIKDYMKTCKEELTKHANIHKDDIKKQTVACKQEIQKQTDACNQEVQKQTDKCKQNLDEHANKRIRDINEQFENTGFNETSYKQSCKEMLGALTKYYSKSFCHVNTFPLDTWAEEKLLDIYMPPNIHLMAKEKGFFKETNEQISTYQHMFVSDTKLNQQIFIQGEAGSGKSTFLAKLVMDWCKITSEQSMTMLPMDDKTTSVNANTHMRDSNVFDDLTSLKDFKFVFHVQLRESVDQSDVAKIIKRQIVDRIYSSKKDRKKANDLINKIMKRERCLVLLDGLDEWIGTGEPRKPGEPGEPREIGVRHNMPKLADVHSDYCVLLITTRPWKMTGAKILDSQIDKLMQLDGVDDVFVVSRKILGCRKDCKKRQDLDKKQSEFELHVHKYGLLEPLHFPMMLCLIVQLWAEGTELKGSKCEMYSFLLDSLFKKATSEPSEFQEPTYRCFTKTQYIPPNIEHLNRLAEAAFDLLFSDTQNKALVFTTKELKKYNLGKLDQNNVALKSGILSAKRQAPTLRTLPSFSFIHKSIQEFLAAYHIARMTHLNLIDDVISGYLDRHEDAYLDVSQVFIFLCGLDIMSANKLSGMLDERNNARVKSYFKDKLCNIIRKGYREADKLCNIIRKGYREAIANVQTNIALTLSHMSDCKYYNIRELDSLKNDVRDLHSVWKNNTRNLLSLSLDIQFRDYEDDTASDSDDDIVSYSDDDIAVRGGSPATAEPTSHIEFDMSSCHRLEYLDLTGSGIWLKDSDSAARSEQLVWIVLDSANPVLPSIKHITLCDINCSFTWLNSLLSTLLTLDHEVECELEQCDISSRIEGVFNSCINASITTHVNKCLNLNIIMADALSDELILNAQILELFKSLQLETLNIKLNARTNKYESARIDPNMWDALNSLTINRVTLSVDRGLSLGSVWHGLIVNNVSMLSQALLSNNTETICIYLNAQPYLMDAMHGLPIKSLSLFGSGEGLDIDHVASLHELLSSLKQLKKLSVLESKASPGLLEALHGPNIKSLTLNDTDVHPVSSFAQFLASLTHLETLNITGILSCECCVMYDALHGLKIKSLSLEGYEEDVMETLAVKPLSRLLQSLTQLETLSIEMMHLADLVSSSFFQALHGLNIKSLSLNGFMPGCYLVGFKSWHWSHLFQSLIQLETLSMRMGACSNVWVYLPEALRGLHITRLSLSDFEERSLKVKNDELLSQSISSLTLLETLTLHVFAYIDLQLPQSLKYFNFYCTGISPPELHDLVKALSACTQAVESKLEFGCAHCIDKYHWRKSTLFPPEEYIPVQLELTVQRNITVKRFRILDRIRANRWYESADSAWSVRDNVAVENDDYDDGIVSDDTYDLFVRHLESRIKNRISMRVQSHASSNS